MANSSAAGRQVSDAEEYRYDYDYVPPLAMIKSVPGIGFSLDWALLVAAVALRLLVNAIALEIDRDLTAIDRKLASIIDDLENRNFTAALLALAVVVAEIVAAYAGALSLLRHVEAIAADVKNGEIDKAQQDFAALFGGFATLIGKRLPSGPAKSLDDYRHLFKTLPLPAIADTFQQDSVFAELRVAGPNPLVIARMTGELAKFPVANQQFQSVMGGGDDLAAAIAEGRIYIADYSALDWLVSGSWLDYQKYLWAPIAMFAVPRGTGPDRRLQPVAIQIGQHPGAGNPIVVRPQPGTVSADWDRAKTAVEIADGNFHEAVSHLGQTHLVVEAFIMATNNQLSGHPVGTLLWPHFEGTLFINNAAQSRLIAPRGAVDAILAGTIDGSRVAAVKGAQAVLLDFAASSPPERLAARGVGDAGMLPYYPYRDIALPIWEAILGWTTDYVEAIYATEDGPANDQQLQNWVVELTSHQGGRVRNVGECAGAAEIIRTRAQLAKTLAIIVFTASPDISPGGC
ncbi:MAG TPA: lipoxygenase family protein [Stellaceae bacterium]|jgi:arachidonate 15-lipoxygenase